MNANTTNIWAALGVATGLWGLATALIVLFLERRFRKRDQKDEDRQKEQDRRAEARRQESVLTMRWMECAGGTFEEMANAIKNQHCNGELTAAVGKVKDCGQDISDYLYNQNALINH